MANRLYIKGAEKTLRKLVNWESDDLRVVAVSSSYVVDLANHEFYSDLGATPLSTGLALTGKSVAGAAFDADDVSITMLAGTAKALVIYLYNADPAAAPLLAYNDNILGFPRTTAGGSLPIVWPNGTDKIVSLLGG